MSWLTLALGLIREAATTEMGQDILNDMRSGVTGERQQPPPGAADPPTEAWRRSIEDRMDVADRNTELLVRMLNAQDESLIRIQKRQRVWNLCLAAAFILASAAFVWLWLG